MLRLKIIGIIPEFGLVYADDPITEMRYFMDHESDVNFNELDVGTNILAEANSEGYISKARLEQ